MLSDKKTKVVDTSKITTKEKIVINYKATGKPMKQFEDEVGTKAGIKKPYANKLFQKAKRKTGMNSGQLLASAKSLGLLE